MESRTLGVLFDFEGTLVDFQWRLALGEQALREVLADAGFDRADLARETYATMRNRVRRELESPRREEVARRLEPIYDRYDSDALSRWSARDGAADLLARLRQAGLRVGVVSNIGSRFLHEALDRFGLGPLLDTVVSRNDVDLMKPAGDGIRKAAAAMGVPVEAVLLVGDSRTDVLAARDAGVRVAVVLGGESTADDFADLPPDCRLATLAAVGEVVWEAVEKRSPGHRAALGGAMPRPRSRP